MEKNKDYYYHALAEFARKNGYILQEYGRDMEIGADFIVLTKPAGAGETVISYVLTGFNDKSGSVYTCCYSDLNL